MADEKMWNGKKVLITGINGFIGVNLAKRLSQLGARVEGTSHHVNDLRYLRAAGLEKAFTVHSIDLREEKPIAELVMSGNFDTIFHLASQSDTWKSIHEPRETFMTNMVGTLNLLEAVRKQTKRSSVVLAGTVRAFYDTNATDAGIGLHPYDASKMGMESIATSYFHAYHIPGAVAKNTNVFGENDLNFARLIPLIMKQALSSNEIRLKGNGMLRRDFMYVGDAVDALLTLALNVNHSDVRGKAFTFATGKLFSICEVCAQIQHVLGGKLSIVFDESESLVERNQPTLDLSRATTILEWKSRVSLNEGLSRTIEWYQNYFAGEKK